MGKKLYVGNLPFSVTDQSLADHFAQSGTVESAKVIIDRETGRSRGFAFVEMGSDDEAQAAIEQLHQKEFGGRNITVNEARPQAPRPSGGGGRQRY
jgi:RNA recognition motif-containing protein